MGRHLVPAAVIFLVAAACGGTGHNPPVAHGPSGAAHATGSSASGAAGSPAGGTGGSLSTTAAGGPAAAPADAGVDPGPMHLPRAGTYPAQMNRNGSVEGVTISIAVGTASAGETGVMTTRTTPDGNQQINTESWRPDGIYLTESSYVFGGKRVDCAFQAPVLESKLPLTVGSQWASAGTCTTPAPNASTTTVSLSASVAGTARQVVGGVTVATYVVKAHLSTDTKGSYSTAINGIQQPAQPFELKTDSQLTVYVDAAAGLQVHTITQSTSTTNGNTSSSSSDLLLTSLKPG